MEAWGKWLLVLFYLLFFLYILYCLRTGVDIGFCWIGGVLR
jgi:hypothetical protein